MNTYQIYSKDGMNMGQFFGEDEADALAAMHQDAGYDVIVRDGKLVFFHTSERTICGDIDAYEIVQVEE